MTNISTDKPSAAEMLSFGGAQFATSIYSAFTSYYLMMFLTDIALVAPATTAVLLLGYRLFSAVDTQFLGVFINQKSFRDGKYRPYYRLIALPFALSMAALGLIPQINASFRVSYAVIILIICDLCWTTLNLATNSMLPYLAQDDISRSKFVSFSNSSSIIAYIVVGTFTLPSVGFIGGGDMANGFAQILMLLSLLTIPLFIFAYFRLKERYYVEPRSKTAIIDIYRTIFGNKKFLLFITGFCFYFIADAFKNQTTYYYVSYVLKRPELLPFLVLSGLISPLAMQPIIPRLLRIAKKSILIVFGLLATSLCWLLLLPFGDKPIAMFPFIALYGVFTSISANLVYTVLASFSDDIRLSRNINMSEIITAALNLSSNLGNGIASWTSALVIAAYGYSALADSQSAEALFGIKTTYIVYTAICMAISGFILLFYHRKYERKPNR